MLSENDPAQKAKRESFEIQIAGSSLSFRSVLINDKTPTGAQIADAAGFKPSQNVAVVFLPRTGGSQNIDPTDVIEIDNGYEFIVDESDRENWFTVDGVRFRWPLAKITGQLVRRISQVAAEALLFLERIDQTDNEITSDDLVKLSRDGTEAFTTRKAQWKLNVQGVSVTVASPSIIVREALILAGFDPNKAWHIHLKVVGQPKTSLLIDDVVDLRAPGIEKIRLTPKDVNNGEAPLTSRREFALLGTDHIHLNNICAFWETVIDQGRRWLVIHNYRVPSGYTYDFIDLALEIPHIYPGAQIDMFYTYPKLNLASGGEIQCTHIQATIGGKNYNGWSRHRGGDSQWDPGVDNVKTHLALVESALLKEIGE